MEFPVPSSLGQSSDEPRVSAVSGSSSLIALRGRHLHLAGSYEFEGLWVGAYVDDEDMRLVRLQAKKEERAP